MQNTTKTTIFEHNNIIYATEFSERSDFYDESSLLSLASQGPTTSNTTTPTNSPSLWVENFVKSPVSPGRNIDNMMMQKTKITKYDNRRTLLQRFKSISRRRKVNSGKDEEPLPVALPLIEDNNHSVASDKKSPPPAPATPWEKYSKKNYFRGVISS